MVLWFLLFWKRFFFVALSCYRNRSGNVITTLSKTRKCLCWFINSQQLPSCLPEGVRRVSRVCVCVCVLSAQASPGLCNGEHPSAQRCSCCWGFWLILLRIDRVAVISFRIRGGNSTLLGFSLCTVNPILLLMNGRVPRRRSPPLLHQGGEIGRAHV